MRLEECGRYLASYAAAKHKKCKLGKKSFGIKETPELGAVPTIVLHGRRGLPVVAHHGGACLPVGGAGLVGGALSPAPHQQQAHHPPSRGLSR